MSEQKTSLRDSTLEGLRSIFTQLLATLKDTPSKPVVVRKLTESFHRQEEAIGELCVSMEGRLRAQQESYLSAYKEAVDKAADIVLEGLIRRRDSSSLEREVNQFKDAEMSCFGEIDQQHEMFVERWRLDLERETTAIVNTFHDEAVSIMAESVLADDATEHLDPDSSSKH